MLTAPQLAALERLESGALMHRKYRALAYRGTRSNEGMRDAFVWDDGTHIHGNVGESLIEAGWVEQCGGDWRERVYRISDSGAKELRVQRRWRKKV
jgi:hypothetical protein